MSPSPASIATQKRLTRDFVAFYVGTVVTLMLGFVVLIAWLAIRATAKETVRRITPFCCPDEVMRLSRTINTSLDPCADFHLYTCFKHIRYNKTKELTMGDIYEGDIIQGVGTGKNTTAGKALSGYYRSCLNGISDTDVVCGELAAGMLETFDLQAQADLNKITKFCIIVFGVYGINGVLHWERREGITEIEAHYDAVRVLTRTRPGCLEHIVAAYNTRLNTSVGVNDLVRFEEDKLPTPPSTTKVTEVSVLVSTISRFLELEWLNLAREVGLRTTKVRHPGERYLIDLFTTVQNNQPISVAYLVTSFVYNAYKKATGDPNFARKMSGLRISAICQYELILANNLWDTVYAQALTTPKRDAEFQSIFSDLIEAVSKIAFDTNIFVGEDKDGVKPTLQRLKLLLPSDLAVPSIAVPDISDREFGANYIAVRNYETLMMKEKMVKNYPLDPTFGYFETVLTSYNFLRLSPGYYRASDFNSNSSKFLSMSVLGVRMARVMWHYLLTDDGWGDDTFENVKRFRGCFKGNGNAFWQKGTPGREDEAIEYALALRSVLWATRNVPDWHIVKPAWSLMKMSNAQLFYIRYMDSMCNEPGSSQSEVDVINMPLKHIPDFAVAFDCASTEKAKSCQSVKSS